MVVQDVQDVCVIHNGHKGILQAMNDMKRGQPRAIQSSIVPRC
jgi:hypothetical protein